MSRTIHYLLYCSHKAFDAAWPKIESTQDAMNSAFSWTYGELDLRLYTDTFFFNDYSDPLVPELRDREPVAVGCTCIDDDDWNAALIYRFALWVSTAVPESLVRVVDHGGNYAGLGLCAVDGKWNLDKRSLKASEQYIIDTGRWCQDYHSFQRARERAQKGKFFEDIPAQPYADRAEIQALAISSIALRNLTIDQVADRIQFPWKQGST